jgi:hypothetical protein
MSAAMHENVQLLILVGESAEDDLRCERAIRVHGAVRTAHLAAKRHCRRRQELYRMVTEGNRKTRPQV